MSGPTREHLVALERAHVWPPYTPSERHEEEDPLVVDAAEGPYLFDRDGRRYVDATSSWWSQTLGHRHPRLVRALAAQAERLTHVAAGGATHENVALLAEALAQVAPKGLVRTHFSDDGSTAVEVAIKIAAQYWRQNGRPGRHVFVALGHAYHGDTLGAASLAAIEEFSGVFAPLLFEVVRPPPPEAGDWGPVLAALEAALRARRDEIAGVFVEPLVQGASGMRMHPPAVLAELRRMTHEIDTFLIADEVFTGYGRTGRMWACDHAHVAPDLLCLGKGFTAGILPMGATMASARIYDGFRGGVARALLHGHTFSGHALGCAVAREVLAIYEDERVLEGVAAREGRIARAFASFASIPGVLRTRSLGMIGAADLGEPGYGGSGRGWAVARAARARGVHLRPLGDTIYVAPPLNVPLPVLDEVLSVLGDCLAQPA
jgi:adenosylmethionine-8-amino-7-oxononanoate aminotransferase